MEHVTLDLEVMTLSPPLGAEPTQKKKNQGLLIFVFGQPVYQHAIV